MNWVLSWGIISRRKTQVFLNYYAQFEGRKNRNALYAVYHDDLQIAQSNDLNDKVT